MQGWVSNYWVSTHQEGILSAMGLTAKVSEALTPPVAYVLNPELKQDCLES